MKQILLASTPPNADRATADRLYSWRHINVPQFAAVYCMCVAVCRLNFSTFFFLLRKNYVRSNGTNSYSRIRLRNQVVCNFSQLFLLAALAKLSKSLNGVLMNGQFIEKIVVRKLSAVYRESLDV